MRQLKFRAWDKLSKEMHDSFHIEANGCVIFHTEFEGDVEGHLVQLDVMQFTGLLDRNGKEIYEGDIVHAEGYQPRNYAIEFIEGGFCGTYPSTLPIDMNHWYPSTGCKVEVIGNIYENPELLK